MGEQQSPSPMVMVTVIYQTSCDAKGVTSLSTGLSRYVVLLVKWLAITFPAISQTIIRMMSGL
jgi:hypothetical protein